MNLLEAIAHFGGEEAAILLDYANIGKLDLAGIVHLYKCKKTGALEIIQPATIEGDREVLIFMLHKWHLMPSTMRSFRTFERKLGIDPTNIIKEIWANDTNEST